MHIYSKTVTGGEVNPSDYVNIDPKTRVGNVYPNLYTQASLVMKDIKKTSDGIKKEVNDLYYQAHYDSVSIIMDSVYHYIENEISLSEDFEGYFTKETLREISSNVYQRIQIAKSLMKMFELSRRLEDSDDIIKLTKQNIIL